MGLNFYYTSLKMGEAVVLDAKTHYYIIFSDNNSLKDPLIKKVDEKFTKNVGDGTRILNNNKIFQDILKNVYPDFHQELIKTILE